MRVRVPPKVKSRFVCAWVRILLPTRFWAAEHGCPRLPTDEAGVESGEGGWKFGGAEKRRGGERVLQEDNRTHIWLCSVVFVC